MNDDVDIGALVHQLDRAIAGDDISRQALRRVRMVLVQHQQKHRQARRLIEKNKRLRDYVLSDLCACGSRDPDPDAHRDTCKYRRAVLGRNEADHGSE